MCLCVCQVKKAGEKGWTGFQSFLSGPNEDGVEMETENHQPPAEGEAFEGEVEEEGGEGERVGDLLGSFSDDTGLGQHQEAPPLGQKGFKSYGSTSYGSTGSTREPASSPNTQRE